MTKAALIIAKVFSNIVLVFTFLVVMLTVFLTGYAQGYGYGWNGAVEEYQKLLSDKVSSTSKPSATTSPVHRTQPAPIAWGGPQLWDAVNKSRVEHGVNPLKQKDELCTIASIRLNQILELDKLDGHEGFSKLPTDRPDLKWIFEEYDMSEFLVSGATSPQNAVDLWFNTLGHKKLLTGGEYSFGCIYAQSGFGVAIAAY
ncbi:MAG: hypothetical protein HYV90_01995 [Candidatus Woesebacteria bacterium]|nr:MAG: hypothetical protein HYV90_01995 [Candidatus Woesebacteria bacterium]